MGFLVVDRIAEKLKIKLKKPLFRRYLLGKGVVEEQKIFLTKPLTYMNRSGEVLDDVLAGAGVSLDEMVVVCDNLDLSPGNCRLKLKGSSGGHRGLESIIVYVGGQNFKRIYVGIGKPENRNQTVEYVLSDAGADQELIEFGIDRAADAAIKLCCQDPRKIMDILNRRNPTNGFESL